MKQVTLYTQLCTGFQETTERHILSFKMNNNSIFLVVFKKRPYLITLFTEYFQIGYYICHLVAPKIMGKRNTNNRG